MLNFDLYSRLQRMFGSVKVLHENESAVVRPYRIGAKTYYRSEGGEEYNVCCPFCHDNGFHLYINYTYGMKDGFGYQNFSAAHCFHGCLESIENREELYRILYAFPLKHTVSSAIVSYSEEPEQEILPPGKLVLVSQLKPEHPAVKYLCEHRGFSLSLLNDYGVCYCYDSKINPITIGCIIIPIWFKGEYKGWQARQIGDGNKGPKYFTAPGMKKSRIMYNYDSAILQDHVVVCEGVTDVWRVGPAGVCLFGKSASSEQLRLLKEGWSSKEICLLLDPDAYKETELLYEKLKESCKKVCIVKLPDGIKDAALMDADDLQQLIKESRNGFSTS